jgi:hypothetical protein
LKTFERRYATRDTFGVFKPALKRRPTLNCRYRGKAKPVIGKTLGWKRRSSSIAVIRLLKTFDHATQLLAFQTGEARATIAAIALELSALAVTERNPARLPLSQLDPVSEPNRPAILSGWGGGLADSGFRVIRFDEWYLFG